MKYFFKVFEQENFNNFFKHVLLSKLVPIFYLPKFNFYILTSCIRLITKIKDILLTLDEFQNNYIHNTPKTWAFVLKIIKFLFNFRN